MIDKEPIPLSSDQAEKYMALCGRLSVGKASQDEAISAIQALCRDNERLAVRLNARADLTPDADAPLTVTYTNWRGETALRTIIPKRVWFGSTDWHSEPQWLLSAIDVEKNAERDFALKDFGHPDADALVAMAYAALIQGFTGDSNLSRRICCNGQNCGCMGSTAEDYVLHVLRAQTPAAALAALSARDDAMRAEGRREAYASFDRADWFWRVMDPDDSSDNPAECIHRGYIGPFTVCEIASSYRGPTRFGFNAPTLDPKSDDEEFLHFATQDEAIAAAAIHAALLDPAPAQGVEG